MNAIEHLKEVTGLLLEIERKGKGCVYGGGGSGYKCHTKVKYLLRETKIHHFE